MRNMKKLVFTICMAAAMTLAACSSVFAADAASSNPAAGVGSNLTSGCVISPGETITIPVFLQNQDQVSHSYKLSVKGSAKNYEMYFSANGAPGDKITLQPGAKMEIDLNVTLKGVPSQNTDIIPVNSVRDDGEEETMALSVQVNNAYGASISSMLNQIDILNGKSAEMTFSITNTGAKELISVNIESELPYKWIATQDSNAGIQLKPGETGTVKLTIDVPASQAAGNFTAKFSAVSNETKSEQISVPVTVKTGSGIVYWMAGILLLITGFTLFQFKKHGRR